MQLDGELVKQRRIRCGGRCVGGFTEVGCDCEQSKVEQQRRQVACPEHEHFRSGNGHFEINGLVCVDGVLQSGLRVLPQRLCLCTGRLGHVVELEIRRHGKELSHVYQRGRPQRDLQRLDVELHDRVSHLACRMGLKHERDEGQRGVKGLHELWKCRRRRRHRAVQHAETAILT